MGISPALKDHAGSVMAAQHFFAAAYRGTLAADEPNERIDDQRGKSPPTYSRCQNDQDSGSNRELFALHTMAGAALARFGLSESFAIGQRGVRRGGFPLEVLHAAPPGHCMTALRNEADLVSMSADKCVHRNLVLLRNNSPVCFRAVSSVSAMSACWVSWYLLSAWHGRGLHDVARHVL